MEPADIGRIVTGADPRVSPDGTLVAFAVRGVDLEANRYRSAIWLAAVDGSSAPYQLTAGEHGDANPAWSPDGRRLAFTSRRGEDDRHTLHVAPVGPPGEVVTLCERQEGMGAPAWSPDGTRIAFTSRERAPRYGQGDDDRARPPRRIDRLFSRLDDTGWIVDRPTGVFVATVDGSAPPRLVLGGPYEHGEPAWSPDGTRLAVCAAREKDWDLDLLADVHLVSAEGGDPARLTPHGLSYAAPSWSPDGTRLAALVTDELRGRLTQVVVLDAGTGEGPVVSGALDRQCAPFPGARSPVWDGDAVLFAVEDAGRVHLYRVPADGSAPPQRLVGGDRCVTGYDAAAGTLATVVTTPTALPELVVHGPDGTERTLTTVGAAFHAACPALPAERFAVPSPARDGDVDAWLVRPAGHDGASPVPVLLSIHGGPATQYGERWFDEFQIYASAGYAVLWCNPHGSTGGTEAWMRAIRAPEAADDPGTGWGGIDADDVLAVLDAALARHPFLDAARVGVLGGSYGGYLTSWLVGHTDRFAAACTERAVNNLLSAEWSSDYAGLFRTVFGIGALEHPQALLRMSPISYVRDITTPLLILHSENDLRCHVEQADQLFVALRQLGRDVEYWRFPAEGHELSRSGSPRHRVQRAELILDFFGRHLGGWRPEITWDHPAAR